MSNPPPVPEKSSPVTPQATKKALLGDCWSCRILSGLGLLASAAYVGMHGRRAMSPGGPPSLGIAVQFTFAAGLAAWGIVVITDPVGRCTKVA
ncbi:distal membrane-arm assembly complex protein 1-like [Puntigrus tetrazona]|uniref:distal membrane-arm assembly complex protein 1-like n=1 Tax=Puntigrus tetrazona TaxID=1606681 RepID=UPI001C8A7112|nr:distal membrane-arm assembly complex protein 1-like [Puntigrus tetrazona]